MLSDLKAARLQRVHWEVEAGDQVPASLTKRANKMIELSP